MTTQQAADFALAQWQAQREARIPANERVINLPPTNQGKPK
jgi:hypothetical protein